MEWNFLFFFNSVLLGVGLAMDAFSVSLASGLSEPDLKGGKMCAIAGVFGIFQAVMPLIGWICVHTAVQYLQWFEKCVPWIALVLLACIGIKMIAEGIQNRSSDVQRAKLGLGALLVQGLATSIDELSVGFTIANYNGFMALVCALIIAAVTFIICMAGLIIGKKFGGHLAGHASVLGGIILIVIGVEIWISGLI